MKTVGETAELDPKGRKSSPKDERAGVGFLARAASNNVDYCGWGSVGVL